MTVLKAVVQALFTVLAAAIPAMSAGPMDRNAWINVIILGAGAVMVYNAANIPGWNYAKLIASAVTAVAVLLVSFLDGGLTHVEILQLAMAGAAAIGVYALPNAGATVVQHRTAA
jgi:hypothetical protein